MSHQSAIVAELQEAEQVLHDFIANPANLQQIEAAALMMVKSLGNGGKIISCGNGGSCCDAMHFAEELTGRYRENRAPIAALSISDPSYLSCVGNDYGYNEVFARFVQGVGQPGDILLAISTSGNSPNIIRAIEEAKKKNMLVVGLTGKTGGQMKSLCDVPIVVAHNGYADRVQEIHIKVIHILILLIEKLTAEHAR